MGLNVLAMLAKFELCKKIIYGIQLIYVEVFRNSVEMLLMLFGWTNDCEKF